MMECSCDPLDGNNSIVGNFHKLSCQCTNHDNLATLHLEYVKCPIFLTTYVQRILKKIIECPNIELDGSCEHKGYFLHEQQIHFTFTKTNKFDVHAKIALRWQTLIGANTLTRVPTQQNMIIVHFNKMKNHTL